MASAFPAVGQSRRTETTPVGSVGFKDPQPFATDLTSIGQNRFPSWNSSDSATLLVTTGKEKVHAQACFICSNRSYVARCCDGGHRSPFLLDPAIRSYRVSGSRRRDDDGQ